MEAEGNMGPVGEEGNMGPVDEVNEVGFKKPPVHSQFKKGCSGNPKGRPKGTKNLSTDLNEVLQERITVKEGDRTKRMSKQRALLLSLYAKSLKGDARSTTILLNMAFRILVTTDTTDDVEQPLDASEEELLAAIEARRQRKAEPTTNPVVPPEDSGNNSDVEPDKSGSQS